jgi:hypothetical protein
MPQLARALNDGDHISSIKTDAVALHNRVMCRVGDADQHCGKYSRFLARCGAIFPAIATRPLPAAANSGDAYGNDADDQWRTEIL